MYDFGGGKASIIQHVVFDIHLFHCIISSLFHFVVT